MGRLFCWNEFPTKLLEERLYGKKRIRRLRLGWADGVAEEERRKKLEGSGSKQGGLAVDVAAGLDSTLSCSGISSSRYKINFNLKCIDHCLV